MVIGVITRRRPELLRRCLTNLAANARRDGHDPLFIVVEDGGRPEDDDRTRAALYTLDARLMFVDRFVRAGMARHFDDIGLDGDLVRFGIARTNPEAFAPGAARNALLLATAGQKLLMVDDDTTGEFACGEFARFDHGTFLTTSEEEDPTQFRFFPDRASALEAARWRVSGSIDAASRHLDNFPLVHLGVVGHSGMQTPAYGWRFATHEGFVGSSEVHRFVARPTFAPLGFCQTICIGLNGEVPPFPPHHYAEDATFGAAMRATKPGQKAVFLPVAAIHDPPERPPPPDLSKVVRANDVLTLLLRVCAPGSMQSVGAQLVAMSRTSFFEDVVMGLANNVKPGPTVAPEFGGSILRLSEYVERYGRLLEAWPAMLSAATPSPGQRPFQASE